MHSSAGTELSALSPPNESTVRDLSLRISYNSLIAAFSIPARAKVCNSMVR